ncbi:MAG: hypothetical protein ACRDGV_01095 [Candidatus Limnocylindria bacterium]
MRIQKLAPPTALGIALALLPGTVAASCMEFPPIAQHLAQAEVVLVGTVREVANEDRTAQVEVHEIWSGPEVPSLVTIHGGPDDPTMMTSADRFYRPGTRYLFAVQLLKGRLEDNGCTATQEWTDDLAALRPADATSPPAATTGDGGGGVPATAVAIGLAVLAVATTSILAFRARR